jgi:hypothetical protein
MFQTIRMLTGKSQVNKLLAKHFQGLSLITLVEVPPPKVE